MLLATLVLACSPVSIETRTALHGDPVSPDPVRGVWRGIARGDGENTPARMPVSMWMSPLGQDGDSFAGKLLIQGFPAFEVEADFDALNGELSFEGSVQGVPFEVSLELADDGGLRGEGSSFVGTMQLELERIADEVLDEPAGATAPVDPDSLEVEAWIEDVHLLGRYLPQVHLDAFHTIPREEWQASIEELAGRMEELEPLVRAIEMARLVARVGDAHTGLSWRELPGFGTLPIALRSFSDGLFVTAVDEAWADVLGTRVVRIGGVSSEEAFARASSVLSAENDAWRRVQVPGLLTIPKLLATLGVTDSETAIPIRVALPDGEEIEITIGSSGSPGSPGYSGATQATGTWLSAPDPSFDEVPLWMTRTRENYWFEPLEDRGAIYFAYNRCAMDPNLAMSDLVDDLLVALTETGATRLVIDLRHNSGGSSLILSDHIDRIAAHSSLQADGSLIALTSGRTYSSGKMNAMQLRWAGAKLIGEPTGGKPNSYGEVRSFRLPNTGLAVYYSTKYFALGGEDAPESVMPDVLVPLSAEEYFGGVDPVLERALR